MIDGITVTVDAEAVVVSASAPLAVISSAPVGGGRAQARTIVNRHVAKDFAEADLDALVAAFVAARGLPGPAVGFFTAARTERAEVAVQCVGGVAALAVVTVGLTGALTAGVAEPAAAPVAGTINTVVIVDAALADAALVNAVAAVGEVKASVLAAAGVRGRDGAVATGTATDAVLVGMTGRGPLQRFGGPVTAAGGAIARAVRQALDRGVTRWLDVNG